MTIDRRQSSKMRVAYNSVFRRLFFYSHRESVSGLQQMLRRPTWEELISNVNWEKSQSQSSTFWHNRERQGFHFLMRKLGLSTKQISPPMKLIGWVNWMILFYLAPSRMLNDKYFGVMIFRRFIYKRFKLNFFFNFLLFCEGSIKEWV